MDKRWRLANDEDVKDVAARLRKEDVIEGLAIKGFDVRPWLVSNYNRGLTYTMLTAEGDRVGLCGVDDAGNGNGVIWMIGTDLIMDHQMAFLKHGRRWLKEVTRPYKAVGNVVHAKNTVHLKWLSWMGFTFVKYHEKLGPLDEPFYEFIRIT